MADKTIQELPQASTLTGDELVLIEQDASAKKVSINTIAQKIAEGSLPNGDEVSY